MRYDFRFRQGLRAHCPHSPPAGKMESAGRQARRAAAGWGHGTGAGRLTRLRDGGDRTSQPPSGHHAHTHIPPAHTAARHSSQDVTAAERARRPHTHPTRPHSSPVDIRAAGRLVWLAPTALRSGARVCLFPRVKGTRRRPRQQSTAARRASDGGPWGFDRHGGGGGGGGAGGRILSLRPPWRCCCC